MALSACVNAAAQHNLLLNSYFTDINICEEYAADCGVEAWFYLKDVKVAIDTAANGQHELSIQYQQSGNFFTPVVGTLLPCPLQPGRSYTIKGKASTKVSPYYSFLPAIAFGESFYRTGRKSVTAFLVDSVVQITPVADSGYYYFSYSFTATGNEMYFTLGSYLKENGKKIPPSMEKNDKIILTRLYYITLETTDSIVPCNYQANKEKIYGYNFRHRQMDNNLYASGKLPINRLPAGNSDILRIAQPVIKPTVFITDTLVLSDILFDWDKASLKASAIEAIQQQLIVYTKTVPDSLAIGGHTDNTGTEAHNRQLSLQRAVSVKNYLLSRINIAENKVSTTGFAAQQPIQPNTTTEGRSKNRRVTLVFFYKRPE